MLQFDYVTKVRRQKSYMCLQLIARAPLASLRQSGALRRGGHQMEYCKN